MLYREFPCHQRLASSVECFWTTEASSASKVKRVVPDGCIDIIFTSEETPQTNRCQLRLVGPMTFPVVFSVRNPTAALGVRFRPGGAAALLGIPARELQDRSPSLEHAWGAPAGELLERLAEPPAPRLCLMQDFLLSRLESACSIDPALQSLIGRLENEDDPMPVESLAKSCGYGPRRLRRAFDRWVGLSPKQFSRIMRFQRLLRRVQAGCPGNWAEQAMEYGYYDQPHMNRDFRQLAGVAPSSYFAA